MKQQIHIRASALTSSQLTELTAWWGVNQTEALTVLIDRAYRLEKERRMESLIEDIISGKVQPETNYPTTGETFFYMNTDTPMTDIGRVPGKSGQHVLKKPDGGLFVMGGYYLRRPNETWEDIDP